jgi:hypothetical protein
VHRDGDQVLSTRKRPAKSQPSISATAVSTTWARVSDVAGCEQNVGVLRKVLGDLEERNSGDCARLVLGRVHRDQLPIGPCFRPYIAAKK